MTNQFSTVELAYLTPFFILATAGMLLALAEAFLRGRSQAGLSTLAVAGCVGAAGAAIIIYRGLAPDQSIPVMYGMIVVDRFGCFFTVLTAALTAGTALISARHQDEHGWSGGAVHALLLLAAAGMVLMVTAGDLVTIFLGIETMSLAVYVLTALRRHSLRSSEAAMKYFLMGAFATGFLLYGIALLYGATGHTNLARLSELLHQSSSPGLVVAGMYLLIVALAFKVAAVPFHMWAPDAYEGAPTPVTGFMAGVVKAAAFAAVLRLFGQAFAHEDLAFGRMGWASPLVVVAAITMTAGNLAALRQANIKRMLAYSSISHAGIVLVGVIAAGLSAASPAAPEAAAEAQAAVMYYLLAYGVTTIGAFAVASWIGSRGRERVLVDDWAGLASQHPAAALAMAVFMLSLGGIPPTAGFFGKFYVFKSAMAVYDQQLLWLVVLGVVNSAISIYYYLRVVTAMYFRDALDPFKPLGGGAYAFVMAVCALAVLQMGILPGFWLSAAGG
ncbi:NADH-quinone oxidoreductase subunit N [Haliangium sp.]|uniref:NADH-quinone oxidoreductase subunit N n=1 Tax=Haliangium sp. TaxID=2663208 RepID=UPI003D14BCF5